MKKIITILLLAAVLLTLCACGKTYTVTFDFDNGQAAHTEEVKEGEMVVKPTRPTKEGCEFNYWELNGEEFDFTKGIEEDLTLKANYTRYYTVTFNAEGKEVDSRSIKEGELVTAEISLPIPPEKEGYEFAGWQLNGKDFDFNTPVTEDLNLVANYSETVEPVTGISLNKNSLLIARGKSDSLTTVVAPETATNKSVYYTSTHPEIATVDANGKISAIAKGTTTIIATSSNGKTATCEVEVFVAVEKIELIADRTTIAYSGADTATFTVKVYPSDANLQFVSWDATGNIGGQNGAYTFNDNGNTASLTARAISVYDQNTKVKAYIKDVDGSLIYSNEISVFAEKTISLTKQSGTDVTWKYEDGKYTAICANHTNLEIKSNVSIKASFNSTDYIDQEHYEDTEVWITLSNSHDHAEGFQMILSTPGGQTAVVIITVSNLPK